MVFFWYIVLWYKCKLVNARYFIKVMTKSRGDNSRVEPFYMLFIHFTQHLEMSRIHF